MSIHHNTAIAAVNTLEAMGYTYNEGDKFWTLPEPIYDRNPTRMERIAGAVFWIGGAAIGITFYVALILWMLK